MRILMVCDQPGCSRWLSTRRDLKRRDATRRVASMIYIKICITIYIIISSPRNLLPLPPQSSGAPGICRPRKTPIFKQNRRKKQHVKAIPEGLLLGCSRLRLGLLRRPSSGPSWPSPPSWPKRRANRRQSAL